MKRRLPKGFGANINKTKKPNKKVEKVIPYEFEKEVTEGKKKVLFGLPTR